MSFRRGLNLTILTMGAFTLALIVILGSLYQQLALEAEQQTLQNSVAIETDEVMNALAGNARQLGLDIQRDPALRRALGDHNGDTLTDILANQFHRYFVTAGIIRLNAIIALDPELGTLATVSGKPGTTPARACPRLMVDARRRGGSDRLRPLTQLCVNGGRAEQQVMVPVGLKPLGYIVVSTDPAYSLVELERRLSRPVSIAAPDGTLLYRSTNWNPRADDAGLLIGEYRMRDESGAPVLSVSAQSKPHAFHSKLAGIQKIVLMLAVLATLATMAVAHYFARKIILEPLQALSRNLRGSDAGRRIADRARSDTQPVCELSELQELYGALEDMALTDPLTRLPNRLCFEQRLEQLIQGAHENDEHHALCYLDLDQFKIINDTCGHAAGDLLLQQLAARFREHTRAADTFARVGGDEFAVLLEHCTPPDAMRIAEQIRESVRNFQFFWRDRLFSVGVSIGVIPIHSDSGNSTRILSLADAACYVAKQQGRNRVHLYRDNDTHVAARQTSIHWASELQLALAENRFRLFCQPVVCCGATDSDKTFHEVLVWLEDTDGKLFAPGRFLPAACKYSLATDIDEWVFRELLRQIGNDTGKSRAYSVNISGQSLADDTFLKFVIDELDRSGVEPGRILFELTESAAAHDFTRTLKFISVLKGMGCRFVLDDFGSGLTSFTYLQKLTVDFVKIDGGFVSRIPESDTDRRVLDAIVHISRALHIHTIAECVESETVLNELRALGVDYAQGFLFGEPAPLNSVLCNDAEPDQAADPARAAR